jgi:hypothetical protein
MASRLLKSTSFRHAVTKGSEREIPVQDFLKENLPGMYQVVKGEVVDLFEKHSPQLDVMIFDGQRNFAFYSGESCILPAEAFLVGIEIKGQLNRNELKLSLTSASKLKALKPFQMELASRKVRGEAANRKCRYFYCLFAYTSDIAEDDWLSKESARLAEVAKSLRVPDLVLDRLYVANRGLINPTERRGIIEKPNSGVALMNLYMHTLNFLLRENKRRKPAPYIEYAGRLAEGWTKLH